MNGGDVLFGKYILETELHRSYHGSVWKAATLQSNAPVVIKIVPKNAKSPEAKLHTELDHVNIIKINEVLENENSHFLVMPFFDGKILRNAVPPRNENSAREVFIQLLDAVNHCHSLGIIHRDIKSENILVDENMIVALIDFGFAMRVDDDIGKDVLGTPAYVAPELLQGSRPSFASDIWSLGIVLYLMVAGELPYDEVELSDLIDVILRMRLVIPDWVSPALQDLLRKMLEKDPTKRITSEKIRNHDWYLGKAVKRPSIVGTVSYSTNTMKMRRNTAPTVNTNFRTGHSAWKKLNIA